MEDNQISGTNDRVMCFHCNQYGHYANVCPHKRQQKVAMTYGGYEQEPEPMESMLGKRHKADLSMKIEKLFRYRDEEEKYDRVVRVTGKNVNLREMPFRHLDIQMAVQQLATNIQMRSKTV